MKVTITGAAGQLGMELKRTFSEMGIDFVAKNRIELDITNTVEVSQFLDENHPDWIVNCAAYTKVDLAEVEIEESLKANAEGPKVLAQLCRNRGIKMIHISTDSVFSSDIPIYFGVEEEPNPLNQYSRSKSLGEKLLLNEYPNGVWIVRTSWLYGEFGGKFVHAILGRLNSQDHFQVVNDQYGQPTNTKNLANYLYELIILCPNPGIYHFADDGYVSRFDFAKQIIRNMGGDQSRIIGIETFTKDLSATRPKYSLLELKNSDFPSIKFIYPWKQSLEEFTRTIKGVNSVD